MAVRRSIIKEIPQESDQFSSQLFVKDKSAVERFFPLIFVVMLVMSFALGSLWTKVQYLSNPSSNGTTNTNTAGTQQPAANPQQQVQVSKDTIKGLFDKNLVKFGDKNKKLLFVEVADPSCPFCHIAGGKNPELNAQSGQFKLVSDGGTYTAPVPEMKKLVDAGKAGYVYLYQNGHGNGEVATIALYCAHDQKKYWEVHDKLMTNAGYALINDVVKNDRSKAGELVKFIGGVVNSGQLQECITSGKYDQRLRDEQQLAAELGARGTPGFFVNETSFPGAYNWTDMKAVVDAALN